MNIKYNEKEIIIDKKMKICEILEKEINESEVDIIGAVLNNEYVSLSKIVEKDSLIELIDISSKEGMKIYRRTLIFILVKAFENLFPNLKLFVNYQLPNSMFCSSDDKKFTNEELEKLELEMRRIVSKDLEIKEDIMTREEAKKLYKLTDTSKGRLQIDLNDNEEIYMYTCENHYNYFYDVIANRTGITDKFEIEEYEDGFSLVYPDSKDLDKIIKKVKSKKLAWGLEEYHDIYKVLDIDKVYKLNKLIENNDITEAILLSEALHEKKIAGIADDIVKNRLVKMVLVAGPSSSGKTTFAKRLGIQLKLNGIKTVTLSVDNYFVERKDNPKDEFGNYDFETIDAIDLELFNDHLSKLLNGEKIEIPEFDFTIGSKKYNGKYMQIKEDEVLVIEGIHCLNDKLTSSIAKDKKYKVYISALTVLHMDRYNRISTTDTRLIRRMVRDFKFRGYTAKETLKNWPSVNNGEYKYIYPFQEEADSIFNTSLIYELTALKPLAEPLLKEIKEDEKEYREAKRMLNILKYIKSIPSDLVPRNSLLKEFLGGGFFD